MSVSSFLFLVEEIPAETEAKDALVERIVGREEIVALAGSRIHMAHHDEETGVLEVEVGIDVDNGIVAHFDGDFVFLHDKLADGGTVVGCIVFREIAGVGAKVAFQHAGYLEPQEEVGVDVQVGHGQGVFVGRLLPRDGALPVERSQREVLGERGGDEVDGFAALAHVEGGGGAVEVVVVHVVALCEIGVVLDFVDSHAQGGAGLLVAEEALYACVDDFRQVVVALVVPPEVA